jgi:V/A-type H+-transporting ATPase subunit E
LPEGDLTAEVNADDLPWLAERWETLLAEAAPGREITLAEQPTWAAAAEAAHADNSAKVDNRFEGRLARSRPISSA